MNYINFMRNKALEMSRRGSENKTFAISKKVLKFDNSFRCVVPNCKKIILVRFNRTSCIIIHSSLLYTYGKTRKLA